MGLALGKAKLRGEVKNFSRLSSRGVQQLWVSFNQVSDSLALNAESWAGICWDARESLREDVSELDADGFKEFCDAMFLTLDTDENGLIDALEALAVVCLLSDAPRGFKLYFVFTLYDFDLRMELALDELTLLFRTTAYGLTKVCEDLPKPTERQMELLSQQAFQHKRVDPSARLSFDSFVSFCSFFSPEVDSWINYFSVLSHLPITSSSSSSHANQRVIDRVVSREWEDSVIDTQPSDALKERSGEVPNVQVELRAVSGMNEGVGAHFVAEGQSFLLPCANVVCLLEASPEKRGASRLFRRHTNRVSCVATHPNGEIIASWGQEESKVLIWSANCSRLQAVLNLPGDFAVHTMSFGAGEYLAVAGASTALPIAWLSVFVFNWQQSSSPVFSTRVNAVLHASGIAFSGIDGGHSFAVACRQAKVPLFFEFIQRPKEQSWVIKYGQIPPKLEHLERTTAGLSCILSARSQQSEQDGHKTKGSDLANLCKQSCSFFTGDESGNILQWLAGVPTGLRAKNAHEGPVADLAWLKNPGAFLSCGRFDALVKIWSHKLEAPLHVISLLDAGTTCLHLAVSSRKSMVLLETNAGLLAFKTTEKDVSHATHCVADKISTGAVTCLTLHPVLPHLLVMADRHQFCLKIYEYNDADSVLLPRNTLSLRPSKGKAASKANPQTTEASALYCDISPCGKLLASSSPEHGVLLFLSSKDFEKISLLAEIQDFEKYGGPCSARFSPDGSELVVVAQEGVLFVYNIDELRFGNKGGEGGVEPLCKGKVQLGLSLELLSPFAMDFSVDSDFLRFEVRNAGRIFHVNLNQVKLVEDVSNVKDVAWHSSTCLFAWGLQGCWPENVSLSTELSLPTCSTVLSNPKSVEEPIALLGRSTGELDCFLWPRVTRTPPGADLPLIVCKSHAHPIVQVLASEHSTSKEDQDAEERERESHHLVFTFDGASLSVWSIKKNQEFRGLPADPERHEHPPSRMPWMLVSSCSSPGSVEGETPKGMEHRGNEPKWRKQSMKEGQRPVVKSLSDPGMASVKLGWVYGFNTHVFNGVFYVSNPKTNRTNVIYSSGNVVVSLDTKFNTQNHFVVGTGNITSLCGRRSLVVVGDDQGFVHVLKLPSLEPLVVVRSGTTPVSCLSLDPQAKLLALVCGKAQNIVRVLEWSFGDNGFLGACHVGFNAIYALHWLKRDLDEEESVPLLVGAAKNAKLQLFNFESLHMTFQTVALPENESSDDVLPSFLCATSRESATMFIGDSLGGISRFEFSKWATKPKLVPLLQDAHGDAVTTLRILEDGSKTSTKTLLVSAGMDAMVKVWRVLPESLELDASIDTNLLCGSIKVRPGVIGLDVTYWGLREKKVKFVIGNQVAQVIEIGPQNGGELLHPGNEPLAQGHQTMDTISVACSPVDPDLFCSVADDSWLNLVEHRRGSSPRLVAREYLGARASTCSFAPDGKSIAIGLSGSAFAVYKLADGEGVSKVCSAGDTAPLGQPNERPGWGVSVVQFHPDGGHIAVAVASKIHYFSLHGETAKKVATFEGHDDPIASVEFSLDGSFFISLDKKGNVHKVDVASFSDLEDLSTTGWVPKTTSFGSDFLGLWSGSSSELVQCVHVNRTAGVCIAFKGGLAALPFPVPQEMSSISQPGHPLKRNVVVSMSSWEFPVGADSFKRTDKQAEEQGGSFQHQQKDEETREEQEEDDEEKTNGTEEEYSDDSDQEGTLVSCSLLTSDSSSGAILRWSTKVCPAFAKSALGRQLHNVPHASDWSLLESFFVEASQSEYELTDQDIAEVSVGMREKGGHSVGDCSAAFLMDDLGKRQGSMKRLAPEHIFGFNPRVGGAFFTCSDGLLHAVSMHGIRTSLGGDFNSQVNFSSATAQDSERAICSLSVDLAGQLACISRAGCKHVEIWDVAAGILLCCCTSRQLDDSKVKSSKTAFSPCGTRVCLVATKVSSMAEAKSPSNIKVVTFRTTSLQSGRAVWGKTNWIEESTFDLATPRVHCVQWLSNTSLAIGGEGSAFLVSTPLLGKREIVEIGGYGLNTNFVTCCELPSAEGDGVWPTALFALTSGHLISTSASPARATKQRVVENVCEEGAFVSSLVSKCLWPSTPQNLEDLYDLEKDKKEWIVISGDSKGVIHLWDGKLQPHRRLAKTIDLRAMQILTGNLASIVCLDVSREGTKLTASIITGEVLICSTLTGNAKVISASHGMQTTDFSAGNKLWAMAVSPAAPTIVATGDEAGFITIWDVSLKVTVLSRLTPGEEGSAVHCLTWSPDGLLLAAGFGNQGESTKSRGKAGTFSILNPVTLETLFQGRDSKVALWDIKFSPDGRLLTVLAQDGILYLYDAKNGFKLLETCAVSQESVASKLPRSLLPLMSFDFSANSMFIRAASPVLKGVMYNSTTGEVVPLTDKIRTDTVWETWTCIPALNLEPVQKDLSRANLDGASSLIACSTCDVEAELAVFGLGSGLLAMKHLPLPKSGQARLATPLELVPGHCGPVPRVCVVGQGKKAVSIGLNDCALIVWSLL